MHNASFESVLRKCRDQRASRFLAAWFLIIVTLLFCASGAPAWTQDAKPAPDATPAPDAKPAHDASPAHNEAPQLPPSSPSQGKALVYIYRVGKVLGSAFHDHLYVNGVYLAYLKNNEYAWIEVDQGTVVVTGFPEMYYSGGIAMSTYAAVKNTTKKENERIRIEAVAGKTYYLKWTSSTMATGIKVTLVDPEVGAREMSKLHLSKPVEQPNDEKKEEPK